MRMQLFLSLFLTTLLLQGLPAWSAENKPAAETAVDEDVAEEPVDPSVKLQETKTEKVKQEKQDTPATSEGKKPAAALAAGDYVMLRVNGEDVTHSQVLREAENIWRTLLPEGAIPNFDTLDEKVKLNILREIVHRRLAFKEAQHAGYPEKADIQRQIEDLKRQVITEAYIKDVVGDKISEDKMRAAYEERAKEMRGVEEIRARHILVETEDEAKEIRKKLTEGADFTVLAKEKSIDTVSAMRGGDLGYFREDQMDPEFGKKAFALKKGEFSQPVKSEYGWHIIQVQERRKAVVPPFEEMRDALADHVRSEAVSKHLRGLAAKADIRYYGADGSEKEWPKTSKTKRR